MAQAPPNCVRCGAPGPEEAAFCVECGARIVKIPPAAEIAGPTPASKGSLAHTMVLGTAEGAQTAPKRRASSRGMPPVSQRPSLPSTGPALTDVSSAAADGGAAASMSEALADVIGDQAPHTAKLSDPAGSGGAPQPLPALDFAADEIDQSFEALLSEPMGRQASEPVPGELAEVEGLFRQIAASYLGPVRDFMVELGVGTPSKEWLAVCAPAVQSLHKSATSMELTELARALERLGTAFDEVERLPGDLIGDVARHVIENAHHDLARLLPEAFAIAEERDRREPIIVQTLLRQVPDVRKVALDKIYAAGLTRLEMFYVARAQDLADATGLAGEICVQIVERFQAFKREAISKPVLQGPAHAQEHARLAELTTKLGRQTVELDRAQTGVRTAVKKSLRKQRNATWLELQLVLARIGRIDLIETLEKLPFAKRVDMLVRYLAEIQRAANSGG
jgi:hypothetical protein